MFVGFDIFRNIDRGITKQRRQSGVQLSLIPIGGTQSLPCRILLHVGTPPGVYFPIGTSTSCVVTSMRVDDVEYDPGGLCADSYVSQRGRSGGMTCMDLPLMQIAASHRAGGNVKLVYHVQVHVEGPSEFGTWSSLSVDFSTDVARTIVLPATTQPSGPIARP
jgi:hypothetical protein